MNKRSQVTGNVGLYFVCYHLSRLGWNAMPTSRNARGIDILAYDADCTRTISLQVKTLSKRAPVPLGKGLDRMLADYWVIVNNVETTPAVFVLTPDEIKERAHRGERDGNISYWLQPKDYELEQFRDCWDRIGTPYKPNHSVHRTAAGHGRSGVGFAADVHGSSRGGR